MQDTLPPPIRKAWGKNENADSSKVRSQTRGGVNRLCCWIVAKRSTIEEAIGRAGMLLLFFFNSSMVWVQTAFKVFKYSSSKLTMHHFEENKKRIILEEKKPKILLCSNHKLITHIGRHSRPFGKRKEILFHMLSE
jgi:hypothetical protein